MGKRDTLCLPLSLPKKASPSRSQSSESLNRRSRGRRSQQGEMLCFNSSAGSKKLGYGSRAQSTDSLSSGRRKRDAYKSTESLDVLVNQYQLCTSLIELSRVVPRPGTPITNPQVPETPTKPQKPNNKTSKAQEEESKRRRDVKKERKRRRRPESCIELGRCDPSEEKSNAENRERGARHRTPSPNSQGGTLLRSRNSLSISNVELREAKMLARATRALQEHMKDVSEKTKSNCCVANNKQVKENVLQPLSLQEPLHIVHDNITGTTYARGRLLGKGGFAKCYELTDVKSGKTYAGKIISKNRLSKPHQKEKITREVELHRNLKHKHVVGFHSYFEDEENVYIVLENCSRKSLVHVLKSRKTLTEPEVRYYLRHLIDGCKYTHNQQIIHRDLKLGNMLLNDNMHVKIADFGLATKVEYEGEKKMTVCGTPNYIAPEVLQKKGHSYEADIWAIGCVMYALLVGRPPFETSTLKETYMRITSNKYHVPSHISLAARNLIQKLLAADPAARPSLDKILQDDFFSSGYCPKALSTACCDTAPKFPVSTIISRPKSYAAPVTPCEAMQKISSSLAQLKTQRQLTCPSPTPIPVPDVCENVPASPIEPLAPTTEQPIKDTPVPATTIKRSSSTEIKALPVGSAIRLYQMLRTCLDQMPADSKPTPVQVAKPLWVTKWVDYSNKYGFGFQLSDKGVGVLFNDTTRMLLSPDGKTVLYNDLSNKVYSFPVDEVPRQHQKRATLLLYFAQYMDEHLIHGGDMLNHEQNRPAVTSIFMKKWFRTSKAIVMYLNNGTFQVNFFEDHTKVILSPAGQDYQVTYINSQRQAVSYNLLQLRHFGCHFDISSRLTYARSMLENIINIEGETV